MPGFRKGNVPEEIARKQIPDELLITDMAEFAIASIYSNIIKDNNLDVIGRPEISITKIAKDNPLEFIIKVSTLPEIKLPDYKKIASSVALTPPNDINNEDVEKVINDLRQMRAYGHMHGENDKHEHTEELPEINDDFAKSFGNFQTMDDMREKIKENLIIEASANSKDKRRIQIMEAIVEKCSFEIPEILIKSESEKIFSQLESDVSRSGATMDEYLKHINKTKEDLEKDFIPEAGKRAKFQLVLNAISRDSKISPTEEEIESESEKMMNNYPGADKERTMAYADMILTNSKVLEMLENQ